MKTVQFTLRRRFAKLSFCALLMTLITCLAIVIFGDTETSNNLREAGIIIAPIVLCLTANISHYMQLVSNADTTK